MLRSSGAVLARNSLYNLLTQIFVSVAAFVTIPIIVRVLGEETFGILSIIWMVVGYFSVLDLGVGQASVKFLAGQIARGEVRQANSTIWVSVGFGAVIGSALSILVLLFVPLLLNRLVIIPPTLQAEALQSLNWIALAVPFVMVQGAFRAVPMAVQRFDLFNLMFGLSGLLQWGGSLLLVLVNKGLLEIALLTVAIRVIGALAAVWIARVVFPELSSTKLLNPIQTAKKLVGFGGWLSLSQFVSPVSRYLDRAFVVTYHSLRMFTFYSVPFEALSRLQVIPLSLSTTLFPAMSERESLEGKAGSLSLYMRSINVTILLMMPLCLVLIVFSQQILHLWLGGDFALLSSNVFRVLAAAAFIQAVCYVPLTSLQALGRPDIAAKYYVLEIPIYVGLCFLLVPMLGIEGAALAYGLRMLLSTIWFFWITHRVLGSPALVLASLQKSLFVNTILFLCLILIAYIIENPAGQLLALVCAASAYAVAAWSYCLDRTERQTAKDVIRPLSQMFE